MAELESEAATLEQRSLAPDFWSDADAARKAMRRLSELRDEIGLWRGLEKRASDLAELLELAAADEDDDSELAADIEAEVEALRKQLDKAEGRLLMAGDYDSHDAILSIHAGAGGTESQDWAEMLLRMYERWAERQRFEAEVVDRTVGEEAGIKSVTVTIAGRFAYGLLKSERGVHRLVRISPFDASSRRHTSFALVEVSPAIDDDTAVEVRDDDLRVDVFRASGVGGQHVNKTSSAVRITHGPSGIVVSCQTERSQAQNRQVAMKLLRARLLELQLEQREEEQARLKGEHVEAGWGNQIRSYVLQPYQLVKDHRTDHDTGKTQAVLDGEIDGFIDAYLRRQIGEPA